jgi:hypothetical protein
MLQFAAVIAANQHFLIVSPTQSVAANITYFAVVLAGLTTASTILAGRREFFFAEAARLVLILGGVFSTGAWLGGLRSPWAVAAIIAYALGSLVWFTMLWKTALSAPPEQRLCAHG